MVDRAAAAGVTRIVTVGTDLGSSRTAIELAARFSGVYASVGIHPHDAEALDDAALEALRQLAGQPKVVAIGEIGLDYYRPGASGAAQQRAFVRQLDLAAELRLPVVIHNREAHADVLAVVERWAEQAAARYQGRPLGVMHCFSGDLALARRSVELGLCVGIGGPVTFRNAGVLLEVADDVPLERLVVETDAPYLAPQPHRGRRNEPAYVALVAQRLAELRGLSPEALAAATTASAERLFGFK